MEDNKRGRRALQEWDEPFRQTRATDALGIPDFFVVILLVLGLTLFTGLLML